MPAGRPRKIDLAVWEQHIRRWIDEGKTYDEMRHTIFLETGTAVAPMTWKRRLQEMDISIRTRVQDTPQVRAVIIHSFAALRSTDEQTSEELEDCGYTVSARSVGRIRRDMGLLKRVKRENFEEVEVLLRNLLRHELDDNEITGYGMGNVYTHMRSKYCVVGR